MTEGASMFEIAKYVHHIQKFQSLMAECVEQLKRVAEAIESCNETMQKFAESLDMDDSPIKLVQYEVTNNVTEIKGA